MKILDRCLAAIALLGVFSVSCGQPRQSKEAVERGLMEYLKTRQGLDLNAMDIRIASVSFRQNEAEATVFFQAKGSSDPRNSMQMRYVLEAKNGKWTVKGRSGASEHGSGPSGMLPEGHPPTTAQPGAKP